MYIRRGALSWASRHFSTVLWGFCHCSSPFFSVELFPGWALLLFAGGSSVRKGVDSLRCWFSVSERILRGSCSEILCFRHYRRGSLRHRVLPGWAFLLFTRWFSVSKRFSSPSTVAVPSCWLCLVKPVNLFYFMWNCYRGSGEMIISVYAWDQSINRSLQFFHWWESQLQVAFFVFLSRSKQTYWLKDTSFLR